MVDLISQRAGQFTESVIREMTRLCNLHRGVNLAQGFPDFPAPAWIKDAAIGAIQRDINQYAITWGTPSLREAIAGKVQWYNSLSVDPEREITVTCGATEGMIASLLALINPGDEVIIFEPFYENYGPDTILSGATPRWVTLHEPDWHLDEEELRAAFNHRTKAIIINTPNNPTGKVFSRGELTLIADLCQQWDAVAITDEIYEHILYDGAEHVSIAALSGMCDRTITVNAISKTYSLTGWRVGYVIACPALTNAIRKVHDFLTVGAPAPLQEGAAIALRSPRSYYIQIAEEYQQRRDFMLETLEHAGFRPYVPRGAYYIMTDIAQFGFQDDTTFARYLVKTLGLATVPGSSFYREKSKGLDKIRFCFPKRQETLEEAARRLMSLRAHLSDEP